MSFELGFSHTSYNECIDLTFPSVPIRRIVILPSGLPVVAPLTQRLPVRSVPEELQISSVWNDVVHNRRGRCDAMSQTLLSEWMGLMPGIDSDHISIRGTLFSKVLPGYIHDVIIYIDLAPVLVVINNQLQ